VRSLNAGLVEQGEQAAGAVLHREVFGRVTRLSASRDLAMRGTQAWRVAASLLEGGARRRPASERRRDVTER
jgi:hypothetical protein